MKITAIETIPVSLPVGKFLDGQDKVGGSNAPRPHDFPVASHSKRVFDESGSTILSNVIVRIHTDQGITGTGEAACDTTETVEGVKWMIDRYMAPHLIGRDPMDWESLIDQVTWDESRGAVRFAVSGIDLALHDLVGRILGIPVYRLIGGKRREKVLASIEVPRNTPEKQAEHSFEYYQQGIRGIKAKIGSSPERDAECIVAIRERLGTEVSIRADANCGYTVKEAITFSRLVEASGAGLEILEQPVSKDDHRGMRMVREATSIPVEADESAYSLAQVLGLIESEAVDVVNTKCAKAGGIMGVRRWATVALAAGLPIVIGTEWGAGLKVAAKLHLGAAVGNADPVVEFTEIMIHELLLSEPLVLTDGYLEIPDGPGLGMELDPEKLAQYRTPGL